MVIGYHFIFSAYGFWLPNDPRGSWSEWIRVFDLLKFGDVTTLNQNRFVAHDAHDSTLRMQAKSALRHRPVRFNGHQALAIAQGFEVARKDREYRFLALAVLPDHVHFVLARMDIHVDDAARHLKARATIQMNQLGLHPFQNEPRKDGSLPSPWGRKHWAIFIDNDSHLHAAIDYVNRNPLKHGFKKQNWKIVEPL